MEESVLIIQDFAIILVSAVLAGWGCRKIGLSPVVGYLGAGVLIGTPQIVFPYVSDAARVQVLAQLGMVFLMFSIGLGFRLQRVRKLGIGIMVATVLTALVIVTVTRALAALAGLSATEGMFFAAMLVCSSSAVIGKVLLETGKIHERPGQIALAMTLLEDLVAVIMLTLLGSYTVLGTGQDGPDGWAFARVIGLLAAFVILLVVPGLVLVPRWLNRLHRGGLPELETLAVLGLLFTMALCTVKAGFSLALGAFLCGIVVAESSRLRWIESTFTGLRDLFITVFFVAVGMSVDILRLPEAGGLIALGVGIALFCRAAVAAISLLLTGEEGANAVRAGVAVTPIGEFSFIIAAMGVAAGVLPETFTLAAVGTAFVTSLCSPMLMRHADGLADWVTRPRSRVFCDALRLYRGLWQALARRRERSLLWRLVQPRVWQVLGEMLLVSGLLLFSQPVYLRLAQWAGANTLWNTLLPWYWLGVGLLALAPLVAIWRNLQALAMILGEALTQASPARRWQGGLIVMLKTGILTFLGLWLLNVLPLGQFQGWLTVLLALALLGIALFGWRRLIRWHSETEFILRQVVREQPAGGGGGWSLIKKAGTAWGLSLSEVVVPDAAWVVGRSIGELELRRRTGAAVLGIERHGFLLQAVGPATHLFPDDRVLILGNNAQLTAARTLLLEEQPAPADRADAGNLDRFFMQTAAVAPGSAAVGRPLKAHNWPRLYGVQVAAVRRGGTDTTTPAGDWVLAPGDELLLVGPLATMPEVLAQLEAAVAGGERL
jgi:CPA2 family monovalent cation:H+ antiporter-2